MTLPAPPLPDRDAALFLDLDGSLLEFADRPSGVVVPATLREILDDLRRALDGAVAVLSGRSLAQIDALLAVPELAAVGIHGSEWQGASADAPHAPTNHALDAVRARAHVAAAQIEGLLIEDKGSALALHFRQCAHAADAVRQLAQELLRIAGSGFLLQDGNHVVELKPAGADKGSALDRLMRAPPFRGRTPWMLGDDLTDEPAFARARALCGIAVVVGPRRPTQATHALPDPGAAIRWLDRTRSRFAS
jgi:trehalose 6-phosphate phosphatase